MGSVNLGTEVYRFERFDLYGGQRRDKPEVLRIHSQSL